jgi:hypothetical protein
MGPRSWTRTLLGAGALALLATPVFATSLLRFSFDELADHASLIIEGWVVSAESRVESPDGQIATYLRLVVLDRIKGPAVGAELELRFAGGTVAGQTMEFADMVLPAVGETGIYFVESLHERQIHPLVGWSQGHFVERIDRQTGLPGVFTPSGRAVSGISTDASAPQQRQLLSGTGAALGVLVEDDASPSRPPAMSASEFKEAIRRALGADAPAPGATP